MVPNREALPSAPGDQSLERQQSARHCACKGSLRAALTVTNCDLPSEPGCIQFGDKQVTKPQIIPHWLTHPCCRQATCVIRHQ